MPDLDGAGELDDFGDFAGGAKSVEAVQGGVDLVAQSAITPRSAHESSSRSSSLAIQAAAMSSPGSAMSSLANRGAALLFGEPFGAAQQSAAVDPLDISFAELVKIFV